MYCIEESTCDVVGTFCRPPQPFGVPIASRRPGNCARRPPRYAPVPDSGDSGFSVFGQTRSDYTGDHCAAVTRALIFQKWVNDLLLQWLWQLKPTTDKLITKVCKGLKLYLCYETLCKTTSYTVRQGRSQGRHVGHCSKTTSITKYFFKVMSKARYPHFWSTLSKCLASPLL